MNKDMYVAQVEEIKEVLSNMPQNNKNNKQKYLSYIMEQLNKYDKMKNDLVEEITKRNSAIKAKLEQDKVDNVNNRNNQQILLRQLLILDEKNSPYEKIGLDKIIFNINKYYEENLESLNQEIVKAINCFKEVGITLTKDDFYYSRYLSQYMDTLINNNNSEEVKKKLNQIYWKAPNIINQIAMNLDSLYFKYEKYFAQYYNELKQKILSNTSKGVILNNYNQLSNILMEENYSIYNISRRFLNGEDNIKDFSMEKYKSYIEMISSSDVDNSNFIKLNNTLYEYSMYKKYKFLLDEFITLYKEKDKYKNVYKNLRKEISKEEKKIKKINKKIVFEEKWSKNNDKIEMLEINLNTVIDSLKEKYNNLQIQKINEIVSGFTDNLSYYDILGLISTHYIYLRNLLVDNDESITDSEAEKIQLELFEFLLSDKLTILDNISVLDNNNISSTITNIYKLLNIKIEENEIEENVDNYIELLRKIKIIDKINSSSVTYDEIVFQVESQSIVNN